MSIASDSTEPREVAAVHGRRRTLADTGFEVALAEGLGSLYEGTEFAELYARFAIGDDRLNIMMRKAIFNAYARRCGPGLRIDSGVAFRHLETFEIGSDVFIGAQAVLQGRFDGTCNIGSNSWIGPQAFLDARNLRLGQHVGIGPGAKILGSQHTGLPVEAPVIETGLIVKPIHIEDWADVGINAVVLPGVTIGKGAIVGAGAVVTTDVAPFSIVAGVPARFMRWRKDTELHTVD